MYIEIRVQWTIIINIVGFFNSILSNISINMIIKYIYIMCPMKSNFHENNYAYLF